MTTQEADPAPTAEVVGQAFVEQYYHILQQSPELVHRFYQDLSLLSRPDASGTLITVTTMKAIDEKIIAQKYEDFSAQIDSADAQESYEKGVIVLVTGSLTGKDNVKKKFTQTFFLAPQDKGFFVLNDIFRFLEEEESSQIRSVSVDEVGEDSPKPSQSAEPEHVDNQGETELVASIEAEASNDVVKVSAASDKNEISAVEDKTVQLHTQSNQSTSLSGAESAPQEDAPKKSYASIVKVMGSSPITHVTTAKPRVSRVNTSQKPIASPAKSVTAPEASIQDNENTHESNDITGEVADDGHSIYVRNLPFEATDAELYNVFKAFGPIKQDGIQIRSNKQGFCFAFIEFETLSGKQSALKAARIKIGDRQVIVEEKRTNARGSNAGRGRYSSGRGSFRGDGFSGSRGGFGGGRGGYGRSEFRNQGEFSRRPRSSNPRNPGEGYQRVNPAGTGRGRGGTGFEGTSS